MSAFGDRILSALSRCLNQQATIVELACRTRSNNVAVISAVRAMERAGKVVTWRGAGVGASLHVAPARAADPVLAQDSTIQEKETP